MADTEFLTRIRFRRPTEKLARTGLLAWVACNHGLVSLNCIELRRTCDGQVTISFPPSRTVNDRLSCSARPTSDPARRVMQREIVAAAAREGWL